MSTVDYDHAKNTHTLEGPRAAIAEIFGPAMPSSLLDVGCGNGTWLKAALDAGISDVFGIDGIDLGEAKLVPDRYFSRHDLQKPFDLKRAFDVAFCFEVGEHLDANAAALLIESLARHSATIYFSAAIPNQPGQHHINCQWPEYWQHLFNNAGYVCEDSVRWRIWRDSRIEPWYRQNMFTARRDPQNAGSEKRIEPVIHPDMVIHVGVAAAEAMRAKAQEALPASPVQTKSPSSAWKTRLSKIRIKLTGRK